MSADSETRGRRALREVDRELARLEAKTSGGRLRNVDDLLRVRALQEYRASLVTWMSGGVSGEMPPLPLHHLRRGSN